MFLSSTSSWEELDTSNKFSCSVEARLSSVSIEIDSTILFNKIDEGKRTDNLLESASSAWMWIAYSI